jgi:glutamine amidotransferase
MIVVVDYGMGNVGSILNLLRKAGAEATLSSDPVVLLKANRLILPGVGAFDAGMHNLMNSGFVDALNHKVLQERTPILGICLGFQLFTRSSEEGQKPGLGWLDAQTVKFSFDNASKQLKIPHMGWNNISICKPTPLFPNPQQEQRFYFVHSFYVQCNKPSDILTRTVYGNEFTSSACRNNILGVQFHPEKSHRFGLELFKAFLSWTPGTD